jgi:hypothetical protein
VKPRAGEGEEGDAGLNQGTALGEPIMANKNIAFLQIVLCTGLVGTAVAQEQKPSGVLAGPQVMESVGGKATLVRRDFDNKVRILEGSPEEAAIHLLNLNKDEIAKVQAILDERDQVLERLVSENILLLGRLDTANKAGNKLDTALLALQVVDKVRPLMEGGTLSEKVAGVLPEGKEKEFRRLVTEYEREAAKDKERVTKEDGTKPSRFEAMTAVRVEGFLNEVERAYKRADASGRVAYSVLFGNALLSKEQEFQVRELLEQHQRMTRGEATEEQNRNLFLAVLPILSPEQGSKVMANIRALEGKPVKKPSRAAEKDKGRGTPPK